MDGGDVSTGDEPDSDGKGGDSASNEQEIIQALQQEGYSDAEIAHIVHGHILPQATIDDIKMDGEKEKHGQDLDHKKRMNDLDYELKSKEHELNELDKDHKKRMLDVEYEQTKKNGGANDLDLEHKKRLLDLEYEQAKQEKELDIEYKKREMELKLQQAQKQAKHKMTMQAEKNKAQLVDHKKSLRQDAAKTSKAERAGK